MRRSRPFVGRVAPINVLANSVALRLGHCNDRTIAYWRRRDASGDAASDAAAWQKDINGDGLVNGTWTKSRVGDLIHLVALSCTINHQSRAINHYPVSVATAAQTLGTRAQEHKMCMRVPALCTVSSPSGGPWPFREKALKRQGLARRFFFESGVWSKRETSPPIHHNSSEGNLSNRRGFPLCRAGTRMHILCSCA